MHSLFLVGLGCAVGGFARYWCSSRITSRFGSRLPWGTLAVNAIGCLALGVLAGLWRSAPEVVAPNMLLLLGIGICGSFTTVSSFSLESYSLLAAREWWRASVNILLTVALALAAMASGLGIGRWAGGW